MASRMAVMGGSLPVDRGSTRLLPRGTIARTGVRPGWGGRMITRVASVGIRAGDQDRAVDFYVGKLGFEKRRDDPMGPDGRWVEAAPTGAETSGVPLRPG